jgi:predicted PurR-regulated permease PerM
MGYSIDLRAAYQEVSGALEGIFSTAATHTVSILVDLASIVLWLIFIVVVSFYMLKDANRLAQAFENIAPPSYQMEFRRLRSEIGGIWNAFLRGQLILCAVVGTVIAVALAILGVRNALVLGLLAAVLEVIPNVGPTLAAVPAVLIAYFQGSAHLPLTNGWFALLVIAAYVVIQQVENNYLVPRIIGRSLNLHPLVVIIGAIAGGIFAGVLGILLAAPTLATLRVLAHYVYCKMLDLEPFPQESAEEHASDGAQA